MVFQDTEQTESSESGEQRRGIEVNDHKRLIDFSEITQVYTPKHAPSLLTSWDTWEVPESLVDNLDEWTCALSSKSRFRSEDEMRFLMMLRSKNDECLDS